MNVEKTNNMKTVDEFVDEIRVHIRKSNHNWWQIAEAFAEAKDMYGVSSDLFKSLCLRTEFGVSKAQKLAAIAGSERLRKYAVQLSSVHSWGTLYAISSLDDDKFEELKKQFKLDDPNISPPFISQQMVDNLKKEKREPSFLKNYATIQIDEDALKGELIGGDELQEMYRLIAEMDNISPHVRVVRSEIDDKYEWFWMTRIEQKVKQIERKIFNNALDAVMKKRTKAPHQKAIDFEISCFSMSRKEMMEMFNEKSEEAFKYLGIEYEYPKYYSQAESEVSSLMDKYAQKALSHPPHEPMPRQPTKEEMREQVRQDYRDFLDKKNKVKSVKELFKEKNDADKAA